MPIKLDKRALFALASDTRLEMLRELQPTRKTVTQLASVLGIDKAAVHRHLKKLVDGDLVKRYDDHGFVYYGLSWKGRDLLNPNENTKVIIILTTTVVLLITIAFLLAASLVLMATEPALDQFAGAETEGGFRDVTTGAQDELADERGITPTPVVGFALAGALLVVATPLLFAGWRILRRPKLRTTT